jgi:hypothetical protein
MNEHGDIWQEPELFDQRPPEPPTLAEWLAGRSDDFLSTLYGRPEILTAESLAAVGAEIRRRLAEMRQ